MVTTRVGDGSKWVFIDATGAFLGAIYELREEDGIPPTRGQLYARMGLSHTASHQRLTRLERDGLVELPADHRVRLTEAGLRAAAVVMRKHRLAERLLVDIVGLDWEWAHEEAERWQHVLGERVERKLLGVLPEPWRSPFGIAIPALEELAPDVARRRRRSERGMHVVRCAEFAGLGGGPALLHSVGEGVQARRALLRGLREAGGRPGAEIRVAAPSRNGLVRVTLPRAELALSGADASRIRVAVR